MKRHCRIGLGILLLAFAWGGSALAGAGSNAPPSGVELSVEMDADSPQTLRLTAQAQDSDDDLLTFRFLSRTTAQSPGVLFSIRQSLGCLSGCQAQTQVSFPAGASMRLFSVEVSDGHNLVASSQQAVESPSEADLSVSKSAHPSPAVLDSVLTYTLTVTNNGPATATGVQVADTLSDEASPLQAESDGAQCALDGASATCDISTLGPSESVTIVITADPLVTGVATNIASVSGEQPDPDLSNNLAQLQTTILEAAADLSVVIQDSPDPVLVAQPVTYTVTATNQGPGVAPGVLLTDLLPTNVEFVSSQTSTGNCSLSLPNNTVSCNLGTLAAEAVAVVTIVVKPNAAGTMTDSAGITSGELDPDFSDNSAQAQTLVSQSPADIAVSVTDLPDPVDRGQTVTFTAMVSNLGPGKTAGVAATLVFPSGMVFQQATSPGGNCTFDAPLRRLRCPLGILDAGENATVTAFVRADQAGTFLATASASAIELDSDLSNNVAQTQTTVAEIFADLQLTKTASADPVTIGREFEYSLSVVNAGPDGASAVTITDTLSDGLAFVSASVPMGTCSFDVAARLVECRVAALPVDANVTALIRARGEALGMIPNAAQVTSPAADPAPDDNLSSIQTTVQEVMADLSLTSTDGPDPVLVDGDLVYTLSVHNAGPEPASGVVLTDELPLEEADFVDADPQRGTCGVSLNTRLLTCSIGTVAVDESVQIVVSIRPFAPGVVFNQAVVAASEADGEPDNNAASAETLVSEFASDLSLQKVGPASAALLNEPFDYRLTVSNGGPDAAPDVVVTDVLDEALELLAATPEQGVCSQDGQTVSCALGSLEAGLSTEIVITVRAARVGSISNSASLSSGAFEVSVEDNGDQAQVEVRHRQADLDVALLADHPTVVVERNATFTARVRNLGPEPAVEASYRSPLPAGVSARTFAASQGTCSLNQSVLRCEFGTLASGAEATVVLDVRVDEMADFTIAGSVSSLEEDPVAENDQAAVLMSVIPPDWLVVPYSVGLPDTFVGLALVNSSEQSDSIVLRQIDAEGQTPPELLADPVESLGQVARLTTEVSPSADALIFRGQDSDIQGFFLIGDFDRGRLDGVGGRLISSPKLFFPSLSLTPQRSAVVFVFNPDEENAATVTFRASNAEGAALGQTTRPIAALGFLRLDLRMLFPGMEIPDGYLRVTATRPVESFLLDYRADSFRSMIGHPGTPSSKLLVPQFFIGSSPSGTSLRVLNVGDVPAQIRVRAHLDADGGAASGTFDLAAGKAATADLAQLLPLDLSQTDDDHPIVGWLEVDVLGGATSVVTSVRYRDARHGSESTLPMLSTSRLLTVFLQVAQSRADGIFHGLSIVNPNPEAVHIDVRAYDRQGNVSASKSLEIAPETRVVGLLNDAVFFGPGFEQAGGHLRIVSDRPVAAYALIGGPSYLAAIEGQ